MSIQASRLIEYSPRLGELLLKLTPLKAEQLQEALEIQDKEGGLLGEVLVRKSLISQLDLTRVLCAQIGIPFLEDFKANEIPPALVDQIPINYAKTK